MKSKIYLVLSNALMVLLLSSCYQDGPDYYSDLDVVYTNYMDTYKFSDKKTYYMRDKILVDIDVNKNGDTTHVYMKDVYSKPILAEVTAKMKEYGWTPVAANASPNVVIIPAGLSSTTVYYSSYYYYGYYYYYYPSYYVASYTAGTLLLTMIDPTSSNIVGKSPAIWIGAVNGVLTYDYDMSRITRGIDKAFQTSPYLKVN